MKSRTWSRRDARDKAQVIAELLSLLGAHPDDTISDGYVDLVRRTAGFETGPRSCTLRAP